MVKWMINDDGITSGDDDGKYTPLSIPPALGKIRTKQSRPLGKRYSGNTF
jgi:hypothetical protein